MAVFDLIYTELKANSSLAGVRIEQWIRDPNQQTKVPAVNVVPIRDNPESSSIGGGRIHTYEFSVQCVDKIYRGTKLIHLVNDVYDTLDDLRRNASMLALAHDVDVSTIEFSFASISNTLLAAAEIKILVEAEQE